MPEFGLDGPEYWQDDEIDELVELSSDNESKEQTQEYKLLRVYLFFLLMFQTLFRVSDAGIRVLLVFFNTFIRLLARVFKLENLNNFVAALPSSLCATRKFTRQTKIRDDFEKFVACPDCHCIYLPDECILKLPRNLQESKKCCNVAFLLILKGDIVNSVEAYS